MSDLPPRDLTTVIPDHLPRGAKTLSTRDGRVYIDLVLDPPPLTDQRFPILKTLLLPNGRTGTYIHLPKQRITVQETP